MPLPASLLSELAASLREGKAATTFGAHVRTERAVSTSEQLLRVVEACRGPVKQRQSAYNGHFSFVEPTARFTSTVQTIGLWHCDAGSGSSAADTTDNDNDLTLANCAWTTGKFTTNGLSFNGTSSVASATLTSAEPIRRYLYFAAWINPTSGPLFQWTDVLEVYISGGNLVAQVEAQTYTGPAVTASQWQLAHVQVFDGKVFVGIGEIVWEFTHPNQVLTIPAYAVTFGKRDSSYYGGLMDEMRLVADVVVQEDWGTRFYRAQEESLLYCVFNANAGTMERHQDFFGPTVTLNGTSWVAGYLGYAVSFDGAASYATFTPTAAVSADELTIHLVAKFDALNACTLLDQTDGLNLAFDGTHLVAALKGVTNPSAQVGPLDIETGVWYDIALTYDGTYKTVWLNGQKTGRVAATGTVSIPASVVRLGSTIAGASFFGGDLDFLHIASVVLKPQSRPIPRFVLGKRGFTDGEDWILLESA